MNNNNKETSTKGKKGVSAALVICFVTAVVAVGTYTFQNYRSSVKEEMKKSQEQLGEELAKAEETNTGKILAANTSGEKKDDGKKKQDSTVEGQESKEEEETEEKEEKKLPMAENTSGAASQVSFSENTDLLWPTDGSVVMNYSMDKTVYFATLDQYKYNPAMIISGEPGNKVTAAARGIVKSIEEKAATGLTVTVDIGNGYELVYGQLKDLQFQEGSLVEAGQLLGYIQQPSRYYSVEGCNLYFQMLKDGKPVNPLDYLEA